MSKIDVSRFWRAALLALLAPCTSGVAAAHGVQRLTNGRWWNGTGFEAREMYAVEGVLRAEWSGAVDATLDLGGRHVVPPYGDAHNHLFADGMPVEEQIARSLRTGVFYVANPNNLARLTAAARPRGNRGESVDVIYANGGLTASGGHPVQIYERAAAQLGLTPADMEDEAYFVADDAAALALKWPRILAGRPDFLKAYLETSEEHARRARDPAFHGKRGLDPLLLPEIVARGHAAGLRVAVHVRTRHDFRVAVDAGADWIAHLPLERITPEDAEQARARGTLVVTTVLSHRPLDGVQDVMAIHAHNLPLLRDAGVRLALGVDDGNRSVLDELDAVAALGVFPAERLVERHVGDTPRAIFPARALGRLADVCEARFVTLEGDPLEDLATLRRLDLRMNQGHVLAHPAEAAPKPGIADALGPLLRAGDVDGAIEEYWRLALEHADEYDFSELQLNGLGYALLRHGAVDDALRIFELNTEAFPRSFNVWDSLGEAWREQGDRAQALACYRKALELNPHHESGREIVAELEREQEQEHDDP
jgi:hypothetical protein